MDIEESMAPQKTRTRVVKVYDSPGGQIIGKYPLDPTESFVTVYDITTKSSNARNVMPNSDPGKPGTYIFAAPMEGRKTDADRSGINYDPDDPKSVAGAAHIGFMKRVGII